MQRVASDVETEMGPSGAMPECRGQAAEWRVMRPRRPGRPRGPGLRFKPKAQAKNHGERAPPAPQIAPAGAFGAREARDEISAWGQLAALGWWQVISNGQWVHVPPETLGL